MKKKFLIGFATALFAVFTLVNFGIVSNNQKINVSLDDIFHMAQADSESLPNYCRDLVPYTCYSYANKKDCFHESEVVYPPSNCDEL